MWNNGKYLLWQHIVDVYKHDLDNGLHMLPKLSADHILLNSYSVMRVKLAVQVLSDSVARGGSRGGVEGVATPPLRIFSLLFCLILRKIIIE